MRQTKSVKTGMENYRPLKLQFPVVGNHSHCEDFHYTSLTLQSINQELSLGYQVFFFEQDPEFENFEVQESLHRTKHKILQLVAQPRSFLSSSGLKSWDWLCDLIDGLEVLSSQSSWLDSSRYSSSDNFSQLCYGFQAEIPSSHAISSCTNQEHKNHSP